MTRQAFRAVLLDDISPEVDHYALRGKKGVKPSPGQGEFQWITIGAEPGPDGKKTGGHPVMIDKQGVMQTGKFAGKSMKEAFGKGGEANKAEAKPAAKAEEYGYLNGNKGRKTGKKQVIHGGEFEEIEMLEGIHKGQMKWIPTKEQQDKNVAQSRKEYADQQAAFARLKDQPSAIQPVTRPNDQAKAGDQMGLFGEATAPKRDAAPTLGHAGETKGKQRSLFDTKGPADQGMLFATDDVTPDEMIGGGKPKDIPDNIEQAHADMKKAHEQRKGYKPVMLDEKSEEPKKDENGNEFAPGVSYATIPLSAGIAAHRGTSFVPEKRGQQRQRDFAHSMNETYAQLKRSAKGDFDGGKVHLDYDDNRIRIAHDAKPSSEMIAKLKFKGFRWSPANKAWQRQLTNAAKYDVHVLTGVPLDKLTPKAEPKPESDKPAAPDRRRDNWRNIESGLNVDGKHKLSDGTIVSYKMDENDRYVVLTHPDGKETETKVTDELKKKAKRSDMMGLARHVATQYIKTKYGADFDPSRFAPVLIDHYSEKEGDKWITIGGEEGADGKKHGGQPVLIGGDGKIKAGMGGKFEGKTLGQAFGGGKSTDLRDGGKLNATAQKGKEMQPPEKIDDNASEVRSEFKDGGYEVTLVDGSLTIANGPQKTKASFGPRHEIESIPKAVLSKLPKGSGDHTHSWFAGQLIRKAAVKTIEQHMQKFRESQAKKQARAVEQLKANVPGLDELRSAISAGENYERRFVGMMSDERNDGARPPARPASSVKDLTEKYPAASVYLQAESYKRATDDRKATAGEKAMEVLKESGDVEKAKKILSGWLEGAYVD